MARFVVKIKDDLTGELLAEVPADSTAEGLKLFLKEAVDTTTFENLDHASFDKYSPMEGIVVDVRSLAGVLELAVYARAYPPSMA